MEESLSRSKSQVSTSSYRRKKVIRRESVSRIESSSSSIMLNSKDMLFSLSTPMLRSRVGELGENSASEMIKSSVVISGPNNQQNLDFQTQPMKISQYKVKNASSMISEGQLGSRSASRVSKVSKGEESNDFHENTYRNRLALSQGDAVRQLNYSVATPQMKRQRLDYLKGIQQKYNSVGFHKSNYQLKLQQKKTEEELSKPEPRHRYDKSLDPNIKALTEKLYKIIAENKALQAKLSYIKDEESCMRRAAEVRILEQQIKEAEAKYQTLLKAQNLAIQAQENVKKIQVDGVDLAPELTVEKDIAYERFDNINLQLKQAEEQFQIYSSVENLILKYIPSHYYLVLKDVQNVERLVKDFRIIQKRVGENSAKARLQKLNLTSEDVNKEIQLLYQEIKQGRDEITEERERHIKAMQDLQQQYKEEEHQLVKLSSDYNLLLNDFQSQLKYIKSVEIGLNP